MKEFYPNIAGQSKKTGPKASNECLPFIPRQMDDAGLTPAQFRIVCRVSRRGECCESIRNMATGCKLDVKTVKLALPFLVSCNVLEKVSRSGQTSVYKVMPPATWQNLDQKTPQVVKHPNPKPKMHPSYPDQKTPHKGNPVEGNPIKGAPPCLEKLDFWQISKDMKQLESMIQEERNRQKPDLEILKGFRSELARYRDEIRRRGKAFQPSDTDVMAPSKSSLKDRNAGTYNDPNLLTDEQLVERKNTMERLMNRRISPQTIETPLPVAQPVKPKLINIRLLTDEELADMRKQLRNSCVSPGPG